MCVLLTLKVIYIDGHFRAVLNAAYDTTRQERHRISPAMKHDPLTTPAHNRAPDANRAGSDGSACLPEWVVHLIALVVHFMLRRMLARSGRARLPSWQHDRPDLPPGSAQALAASVRGPFGNSIAWMCLRHGIGPGHLDWPGLSCAIVAFGGSVKGFRAGAKPYGLQWWENPGVIPGMVTRPAPAPAAMAMAVLLERQAEAAAPSPAPSTIMRFEANPAPLPVFLRQVVARTATGPPTGPPGCPGAPIRLCLNERGQSMAGPAVLIRADRKVSLVEPATVFRPTAPAGPHIVSDSGC
jgi:hypothetical protein